MHTSLIQFVAKITRSGFTRWNIWLQNKSQWNVFILFRVCNSLRKKLRQTFLGNHEGLLKRKMDYYELLYSYESCWFRVKKLMCSQFKRLISDCVQLNRIFSANGACFIEISRESATSSRRWAIYHLSCDKSAVIYRMQWLRVYRGGLSRAPVALITCAHRSSQGIGSSTSSISLSSSWMIFNMFFRSRWV